MLRRGCVLMVASGGSIPGRPILGGRSAPLFGGVAFFMIFIWGGTFFDHPLSGKKKTTMFSGRSRYALLLNKKIKGAASTQQYSN